MFSLVKLWLQLNGCVLNDEMWRVESARWRCSETYNIQDEEWRMRGVAFSVKNGGNMIKLWESLSPSLWYNVFISASDLLLCFDFLNCNWSVLMRAPRTCGSDLRIMLLGSSSSLTVRQRGKAFTVYKCEVVPQARLLCLQLFSCLIQLSAVLNST